MYCRICGKFMDNDVEIYCDDCKKMLENDQARSVNKPEETGRAIKKEGSAKEGIKKAVFSSIFAVIGFIFAVIGLSFLFALILQKGYEPDITSISEFLAWESVGIVFTVLSTPLAIVGLLFGVKSIKTFQKAKREMRVKPVVTFVLGILGLILNIVVLILIFIAFILAIVVFL